MRNAEIVHKLLQIGSSNLLVWNLGERLENLRSHLLLGLKVPREHYSKTSVLPSHLLYGRAHVNDWGTFVLTCSQA